ncbi:uncharacterized protein LOC143452534 isoform X3 [Clavelina lepadiformis]|uniref:Uncharacterized protein n=1 Tax=Clavelina lepadiformis TaxID=159417 RepID=A0ABP0GWA2_CLALP
MAYAEYSTFSIGPRSGNYVLTVNGYTGNASKRYKACAIRLLSTIIDPSAQKIRVMIITKVTAHKSFMVLGGTEPATLQIATVIT